LEAGTVQGKVSACIRGRMPTV